MKALLFLRERLKSENIGHYLDLFGIIEKYSRTELEDYQFEKLKELLRYLMKYNIFFTNYLSRNNFHLNELKNADLRAFLHRLPLTDKKFIKDNYKDWITTNKDIKLVQATTSGSTGTPFVLFHSLISSNVKYASKVRLLKWNGIKRWEKQLYFGCTYNSHKTKLASLKIYLNDRFVLNKRVIDFSKANENTRAEAIKRINTEKPTSIWGYPSIIYQISRYSLENNLPILNENLKAVVLSGETHTLFMQRIIKQAFKIEPIDEYNSNEGFLASSCEYHKLHLTEDTLIAEILDEHGNICEYGKGELLVTHLYSYDFPFIRYNVGDIVEITSERCKCGRNFKVLKSIDGRKGAVIFNGNEKISNATCNHFVTKSSFIDFIEKYQIIQNDLSSITIKIVISGERDFKGFENHMKQLFNKLDVNFEYVDDIPRDKSGKYRDVVNNVQL